MEGNKKNEKNRAEMKEGNWDDFRSSNSNPLTFEHFAVIFAPIPRNEWISLLFVVILRFTKTKPTKERKEEKTTCSHT